jgi:hypothetical protein
MTILVRFLRDMKPYRAGDTYALPDHVAAGAVEQGLCEIVPSVFDQAAKPVTGAAAYSTRVMQPAGRHLPTRHVRRP